MSARSASSVRILWARTRDSLWFIPAIATLAAIVLAVVAVEVPSPEVESRAARLWLFGGSAEGARGVLTTIAGSLITVTGVVFSVTIVALQLASSQFTPRVLRSFVADRVNQSVLGVFIGTFTYTLLVLRTIRSSPTDGASFVPDVAVLLALLLLLVSIGALIVFINHAARSVQAGVILSRETKHTLRVVQQLYPGASPGGRKAAPSPAPAEESAATVTTLRTGYLQAVDLDGLWSVVQRRRLFVRLRIRVGEFGHVGAPLAAVWPERDADDEVAAAIRDACVFGEDRTPDQDVEFGLIEIADIAVRALSPGINDPTTAMRCIDRLTQILVELGQRTPGDLTRAAADGRVALVLPATSFERAMGVAFDQIRHFAAANPAIVKKLLDAVGQLGQLGDPRHHAVLLSHVDAITASPPADMNRSERAAVRSLAGAVRSLLTRTGDAAPVS